MTGRIAINNKRLIDGPLLRLDDQPLVRVYQAVAEVLGLEQAGRGVGI